LTIQGQAIRAATADRTVLPVEIAFLAEHGFDAAVLRRAAEAARRTGSSGDEALIRLGLTEEEPYYRALAAHLGLPYLAGKVEVGPEARFPHSLVLGLAPLAGSAAGRRFALAPAGRRIAWLLARRRPFPGGFAVASPSALREAVFRTHAAAVAAQAANGLADAHPDRSYRDRSTAAQKAFAAAAGLILLAGGLAAPDFTVSILVVLSGLVFLSLVAVRLGTLRGAVPTAPARPVPRQPDDELPVYTVIVPLRRERRVLARLVAALAALDYPGIRAQTPQAS
jgi:hypothetical protein